MIFNIHNQAEGLWPNRVRLSIDTDQDTALKVLDAARRIEEERSAAEHAEILRSIGIPERFIHPPAP